MPLTQLDAQTALVVIDLQKGIVGMPTLHPGPDMVAKSAQLAQAFREAGQTVVLVNVDGRAPGRTDAASAVGGALPPDFAELAPELDAQPGDLLITKQRVGAFIGTTLHADLQARGVTQVVLTGIATGGGVEASARSAHDHGYNVVVVTDAVTDRVAETHAFLLETFLPRLAETTTVADVLAALESCQPSR